MKFERSSWAALLSASLAVASPTSIRRGADETSFDSKCADLASTLQVENGDVYFTEFVAAGTTLDLPDNNATCSDRSIGVTADMCRVVLHVATSERSGISMEAWLPSDWSGRFLSTGNGGLGGCIQYTDLAYTTGLGFASVATNNGHNGTSGGAFYNNEDIVEDFAYRAMHTGVVVGKKITKDFYAKEHDKSYYLGCSTGGRQGFKMAQDFPDDFDGIVAGAPAISFNNLTSWSGHFYNLTGPPGAPTFVPLSMWIQIQMDVYKQCDLLDGYADMVLEDPLLCKYDPSGLACPEGTNSSDCLTPPQLKTVKSVYEPLLTDSGDLVYPRLNPGTEIIAANVLMNGVPFPYTTDWFRYAIYNDPTWDPTTISSVDYENAAAKNPADIETWKGDLSAIRDRGSKIIHWHGGADFIISSDNSPRYYEHVSKTMGLSPSQLDAFYRFFTVSGTGHCGGGTGAHAIGQGTGEVNSNEPSENVLMAVVDWVEKGNAPETLVGTKFVNDDKAQGVAFQRAHCKFPKRNQYKGSGDANVIENWECVE